MLKKMRYNLFDHLKTLGQKTESKTSVKITFIRAQVAVANIERSELCRLIWLCTKAYNKWRRSAFSDSSIKTDYWSNLRTLSLLSQANFQKIANDVTIRALRLCALEASLPQVIYSGRPSKWYDLNEQTSQRPRITKSFRRNESHLKGGKMQKQ